MGFKIALVKHKENISEYIVHMYQTEDLIRAYNFEIDEIKKYVISHLPIDKKEKEETTNWYQQIISQMKNKKNKDAGHISELVSLVAELDMLHQSLIDKNDGYTDIYKKAKSHIQSFRKLSGDPTIRDIQICLNAVYGLLIIRLNDRPIADDQFESVDLFGALLSYLSYIFKQRENLAKN